MSAELALFDIENGILRPTVHCYSIVALKKIQDVYGMETALEVYKFLYYMCSQNAKKNPFFDVAEHEREDTVMSSPVLDASNFTTEDEEVQEALELCRKLFTTPTSRSYRGFKVMMDNLTDYMENTPIKDGRDGNITALISAGKSFDALRQSFKGAYKELMEEQSSTVRGGQNLAYDQQ